ncbi:MAG: hypothetical protein IPI65_08335 [Bacteroidetes bacterium]|nr:hypothetical protein [Bacteroidota bacterium]
MDEIFKRQKDTLNHEDAGIQKSDLQFADFKNAVVCENDTTFINLAPLKSNEQRNLTVDSVWFTPGSNFKSAIITLLYNK